jgi:serine/threonine-protein kinase
VIAFSLLFGLAGAFVLLRDRGGQAEADSRERTMIAVLPFDNLGSPEDSYFADGMTEEITARLAEIQGLGLISRTSTLQYRDTTKPIKQIGKELDVDYILEGSVRWQPASAGQRLVRITPQLIRVSDDSHVWADVYEKDSSEIFRIQSDIAEKVVNALDITLRGGERRSIDTQPTENLDAYDFYLRGNEYDNRSGSDEDQRLAAEMYGKAVQVDPRFALAWARLSKANTRLYFILADAGEARLSAAKEAVDRSLGLAPDLPEAHLALGYYYYWGLRDYDRALGEFAIARKGQASNAELEEAAGFVLRRQGRFDEALATLKRAAELDPRSPARAWEVGTTLLVMRRYAEAERYLDRAISLAPETAAFYASKFLLYLDWGGDTAKAKAVVSKGIQRAGEARLLAQLARGGSTLVVNIMGEDFGERLSRLQLEAFGADTTDYFVSRALIFASDGKDELARAYADSARVLLERKMESRPSAGEFHAKLGFVLALLGRNEEAVREARRGVDLLPLSKDALSLTPWFLAVVLARVGEDDAAVDELETLLSVPYYLSASYVRIYPEMDPLRDNPRFRKLIAEGKP